MTPEVLGALQEIVDELHADAGVLVRLTPSGSGVVTSSTLSPAVAVGDDWGPPGMLEGTGGLPELALEADRLAALVPTAARLALSDPLTAALVALLAGTMSRAVLLWASSTVPYDVAGRVESGAFRRFALLAPLLDAQVEAREAVSQLEAVAAALDQAVVVTSLGGGTPSVNPAARRLLGLDTDVVDATTLSDAMRALRDRGIDPTALGAEADQLLAQPRAVVRGWIWPLRGSPSHLRVTTAPVDTPTAHGRIWVFDDISAEMALLERQRRASHALSQSEQRYRVLAENVSDIVVQGTAEGAITWVSPSVTTTLGWAPGDLVGRTVRDLVHPDDLPVVVAAHERMMRGEPTEYEVRLRTAGGDHRWMDVRAKSLLDDDGKVVGRVAGLWDTQASHDAKEQLAHSEQRYRLLLENTTEVVFQTIDGVVTWVSPAVEGVTGWKPSDIIGTSSRQLWHPDDWERASWAHDVARDGEHGREVLRLLTPEGVHQWMEVVIRPYVEEDGRPGTVGMTYDVSDREIALEAARRSEERYRTVAENASDVVCRYRDDGTIEWVFGSTEAFLGRSAQDLVGTSLLDHFVAEDWGDLADIRARLARGEAVQLLVRVRHADSGTRWVEVRGKAVLGPDGSTVALIGTMRDAQAEVEYREALAASERQARDLADAYQAARDEAVRASSAKTAFLSRMSHELRTPLNAVLGFAQLLALDPLTPEQDEAVHHIRTGGRHLLDLINEIVDISRIEAGRLSLSMETVDAVGVLAEAVELVRPLAQQRDIVVAAPPAADGAATVADVHADRQRVRQVLLNLMSNAVKYNRPGGSVTVGCRAGGSGEVVFEVSDTGPGIAQELLPRLFEPFDRLGAESSDVEGTGIGLTLADALARAMGGRIEVSTQVGAGSTFMLVLRTTPSEPTHAAPVVHEIDAGHDSRLHILYIEDNPTNATLMARFVALRPGSRLHVAVDGAHGIASALLEPPDLVFLDLHLPDVPGEEVLDHLRRLPGCADVPVVVVTADASPGARERMSTLGSDGFLTKPIDLEEVLGWIDGTASAQGAR